MPLEIDARLKCPTNANGRFFRFNLYSLGLYAYVSKGASQNGVLDFDGIAYRSWTREVEDLIEFLEDAYENEQTKEKKKDEWNPNWKGRS